MRDINAAQRRLGLVVIDFAAGATPRVAQTAIIMSIKTNIYVFASKLGPGRI